MTSTTKPVALVSMPTLSARFPSFQLGLLKPTLERAGIPAQTFSLFMYFGTQVGWHINEALADVYPCMVGEWIWARAAFGDFADDDGYFRIYGPSLRAICEQAGCTVDDLRRVRDEVVPAFIEFCLESIDWRRFGLIGFSVCFQQMLASVALARALKERHPDIPIIMGGAGFEDDIAEEIMRGCPQVDYVHCGDAEETFPQMVRRLYADESMRGLPGLMWRDGAEVVFNGRAPNLKDMNHTPAPEFDEYFYARREGGYETYTGAQEVLLPIETARGCWWGVKNHCTFCGLNRAGMEFRAKDAGQVTRTTRNVVAPLRDTGLQRHRQHHGPRIHRQAIRSTRQRQHRYPSPLRSPAEPDARTVEADARGRPLLDSTRRREFLNARAKADAQAHDGHAQSRTRQVVYVLRHQQPL